MREICKSGSMRGSGRPASNAPATLYSTIRCRVSWRPQTGSSLPRGCPWWEPQPVHSGMSWDCGFALRCLGVEIPSLSALDRAVFDDKRRQDGVPSIFGFDRLEVVGEQQIVFDANRVCRGAAGPRRRRSRSETRQTCRSLLFTTAPAASPESERI